MNRIRRDDAGDTGEQDVRELRRIYGEGGLATPTGPLPDNVPFVRHKEDVPHEHAIPDFYGLDNPSGGDEVEEALLQMVETGELCFGWLEDRGEFGFWFPEEEPEPAAVPAPEPVIPDAQPVRRSHRRPKEHPLARRILVGVAATLAAPFAIGVAAYAADHHPSSPSLDQPDLTADATVEPTPSDKPNVMNYQTSEYARRADAPAPTVTVTVTATPSANPLDDSRATDAQESAQNEKDEQKRLAGRHRKPEANPAAADEAAAKKKHKPHHHHHHKPHNDHDADGTRQGSVSTLVGNILEPVPGLLG